MELLWQPMETAPKDGSEVFLRLKSTVYQHDSQQRVTDNAEHGEIYLARWISTPEELALFGGLMARRGVQYLRDYYGGLTPAWRSMHYASEDREWQPRKVSLAAGGLYYEAWALPAYSPSKSAVAATNRRRKTILLETPS
jgi:hypothetical protein